MLKFSQNMLFEYSWFHPSSIFLKYISTVHLSFENENASAQLGSKAFSLGLTMLKIFQIKLITKGGVLYLSFFYPRTLPKKFLQCFALEQWESKAKHCINVLGRVLGKKTRYKIGPYLSSVKQNRHLPSLHQCGKPRTDHRCTSLCTATNTKLATFLFWTATATKTNYWLIPSDQ